MGVWYIKRKYYVKLIEVTQSRTMRCHIKLILLRGLNAAEIDILAS